ncbi:adenosylcobinamide-phosphate synthase CbiB [Aestuariispira ectoiniformans]|uniref:adenosylcobinamide-phosphate synthase CbiB n=1 Tax=Aestuariispira ectoiniformans TaxID=2775080 RepID=UPI00223B06F9|nr:adenosylcobinamide-phosphate synthase CbiB [Aestuariispira ectoiniformans]
MNSIDLAVPAFGLSTAMILALALVLDWALGDMRWFYRFVPHPVVLIGRLIGILDKRLNRESRSSRNRMIRGAMVTAFVVLLCALIGWGLDRGLRQVPYGWGIEVFLVSILLAARSLFTHVGNVAKALKADGLEGGRKAVAHIVGRDPSQLDSHGVARAAVESLAENFADGVIAPAFWYLIFGLPGILAYKAINTLDSMIGYRNARYKDFGMAAARFDDLANWIPARLTGVLVCLAAALSPKSAPVQAARSMIRFAGKHASPNAGWPEGAMAGALDLALGGPRRYPGGISEAAWIGDGRARLTAGDIRAAQYVYAVANGLVLAGTLTFALVFIDFQGLI